MGLYNQIFVDNFSFRTEQALTSSDLDIYLPAAALSKLPNVSATNSYGVVLVLDDEAGNLEYVQVTYINGGDGYAHVFRDCYSAGYQPAWPAGSLIECRVPHKMVRYMLNDVMALTLISASSGVVNFNGQEPDNRVAHVLIGGDVEIRMNTFGDVPQLYDACHRKTLILEQDNTGGHAVTFTTGYIKWPGDITPTINNAPRAVTVIELYRPKNFGVWLGGVVVDGAIKY